MGSEPLPPVSLGKVLVVGGCGFLGYNVVDQLLNFPSEDSLLPVQDYSKEAGRLDATRLQFPSLRSRYPKYEQTEVHVLDLRCNRNRLQGASYHEADLCNADALLKVFRDVRPEIVINTASPPFNAPRDVLRKVNVEGTQNLVEVAGGARGDWNGKCKAFIHTSSSSVVHDALSDLVNADETWPYVRPHPVEYYSETKANAEEMVLKSNKKHDGMLTCAIRPAGIVGEKDRGGIADGFLTSAANAPSWQLNLQLGGGDNLFDCTYVGNVAFALAIAANCLLQTYSRTVSGRAAPLNHEVVDGEAFNVTNETPIYFWDIAHYMWTLYGRDISVARVWALPKALMLPIGALAELSTLISGRKTKITRQAIKYSCMTRYYNCEKLKRRCGYKPLVGLEEGLARAVREFAMEEKAGKAAQEVKKVQ